MTEMLTFFSKTAFFENILFSVIVQFATTLTFDQKDESLMLGLSQ